MSRRALPRTPNWVVYPHGDCGVEGIDRRGNDAKMLFNFPSSGMGVAIIVAA